MEEKSQSLLIKISSSCSPSCFVSFSRILWDCLYGNYINQQIDFNVRAFIYLAKASLHVLTLTRSSSGEFIEI
jgi:hypothetical protein